MPTFPPRAVKLTLVYLLVATVYIVVSSLGVEYLEPDPAAQVWIEVFKGLGFVVVTAVLLLLLSRRFTADIEHEAVRHAATERALRRSRDQLTQAQRIAGLGSWEADLTTGHLEWSDEVYRIFGLERGAFAETVDAFFELVHADDRPALAKAQQRTLDSGEPLEIEHRIVRPDGQVRHVFERAQARRDSAGRATALIGTVQDITERKLVELELERRNRQQSAIAELGMEALNHTTTRELMQHAMSAAARVLEVEYTKVLELEPDGDALRLVAGIGWEPELVGDARVPTGLDSQSGYTLSSREPVIVRDLRTETRFSGPALLLDHGVVSGISTIIWSGDGPWGVLGIHTTRRREFSNADVAFVQALANLIGDVLEREAASTAIRERNELLSIATEVAALGGWSVDARTQALTWSREVARIHEVDEDYQPDVDEGIRFYAPEYRERVSQCLEACLENGTPWDEELQILSGRGRRIWLRVIGRAERDRSGNIVRINGAIQDISERKALESMLHQSQRLEAVGQLTGGVAHDFNNLLTVILGNADLMVEAAGSNAHLRDLADTTFQAAQRGAELTSRLLAYARKQPLEPAPTNVANLIAGMDQLLRRTLGEQVEIEVVRGGGLWTAMVDPAQLESALLNLCLNARDAMPEGGQLTIETANAHLDEDYARQHLEITPGHYVMIAVTDTGMGVAPEIAERVFEPFFTTKASGQGSGLGLSMVYGFVKQSRGHVKLYSEPGEGTTVKLYLPRTREDEDAKQDATPRQLSRGAGERVLVVEDDEMVRRFVREQVAGIGYEVLSAANAAEALRLLESGEAIDLLFTDVVMPGEMDGRQLAEAARQLRPDLPVLYTSGYTENAIVHQGRLDPGVLLLNKPYRLADLAEKLAAALKQRPAAPEG
jgi:PAS domain S-box-containing protein